MNLNSRGLAIQEILHYTGMTVRFATHFTHDSRRHCKGIDELERRLGMAIRGIKIIGEDGEPVEKKQKK